MAGREDDEPDLTRKQRREAARAQRKELEQSRRLAARRRTRLTQIGAVAAAAAVIAVVAIIAASSGSKRRTTGAVTGSGATAGLISTPAPWQPVYDGLTTRLAALHLPSESNVAYHVHADLRIYVDGQQVSVPAEIGIDATEEFLAPLHTHDTSGIVHMEASEPYPFTLGQFFTVWGVTFTATQLGGYVAEGGNVLAVYVNGSPVSNFVSYVMRPHDDIVVGYGKPGSFPTSFSYPWAANPGL